MAEAPKKPKKKFSALLGLIDIRHEDDADTIKFRADTKANDSADFNSKDLQRLQGRMNKKIGELQHSRLEPSVKKAIMRSKAQPKPRKLVLPHSDPVRWKFILTKLSVAVKDCDDLVDIWEECPIPMDRHEGEGFCEFMEEIASEEERNTFWNVAMPFMQKLVLRSPELLNDQVDLSLFHTKSLKARHLTREQIGALIALAFFCILDMDHRGFYEHGLPIDAASQFHNANMRLVLTIGKPLTYAKFRCLINYFVTLSKDRRAGNCIVTLYKHKINFSPDLEKKLSFMFLSQNNNQLMDVEFADTKKRLIDSDPAQLNVIFSSIHAGGHYLGEGKGMEEEFIARYPEAHLLMLFVEKLAPNEAVSIIGAQRYNKVKRVNRGFAYAGPGEPLTQTCSQLKNVSRLASFHVFLNAQDVNFIDQYRVPTMQRELIKAYCGLSIPEAILMHDKITTINTGNWGVGASGGDVELKFALQWIAYTVASEGIKGPKRKIVYHSHGHKKAKFLPDFIALNAKRKMKVNQGWYMLLLMAAEEPKMRCSLVGFAKKLDVIFQMRAKQTAAAKAARPAHIPKPAPRRTRPPSRSGTGLAPLQENPTTQPAEQRKDQRKNSKGKWINRYDI